MNSFSFACIRLTGCWVRVHLYYKLTVGWVRVHLYYKLTGCWVRVHQYYKLTGCWVRVHLYYKVTRCWVQVHLYYKFAANPLKDFSFDDGRTQGDCLWVSHVLWTGSRFIHACRGGKSSYTTFLMINRIGISIHTLSACRYVPLSMLQPVPDHDNDDHYDEDDDADSNQCHNTSRDFRGRGHY